MSRPALTCFSWSRLVLPHLVCPLRCLFLSTASLNFPCLPSPLGAAPVGYPPGPSPRVYSLHLELLGWYRAHRSPSPLSFPFFLLLVCLCSLSCCPGCCPCGWPPGPPSSSLPNFVRTQGGGLRPPHPHFQSAASAASGGAKMIFPKMTS